MSKSLPPSVLSYVVDDRHLVGRIPDVDEQHSLRLLGIKSFFGGPPDTVLQGCGRGVVHQAQTTNP